MFLDAYEAFLAGIKPAYFCDHDDAQHFEHLIKSNYPAVPIVKGATLFFDSEESKKRFLSDLGDAKPYTRQYFIAVGKALGYPPIAALFFADCTDNLELEKNFGAVFEYAGRYFSGHIDDTEQIVRWLWSNVPIQPAPVKVTYHGETFFIKPDSCYTES